MVYFLDDVKIIENPIKPILEAIKEEHQHYDYTEGELKEALNEARKTYSEELVIYNSAKENGFEKDIVFHPESYLHKEIFYKLIRYILTKQVHFGESNHVNNLTNVSFYNAMQGYYKSKIAKIEDGYTEKRNKCETRLKERIKVLEKKTQELND